MITAISTDATLFVFPMSYCASADAVPTLKSPGVTSPTGRFWAFGMGCKEPPFTRIMKDTVAFRISPPQAEVSLTVALNANEAVLLDGPVVQKNRDPVYRAALGRGPTFPSGRMLYTWVTE